MKGGMFTEAYDEKDQTHLMKDLLRSDRPENDQGKVHSMAEVNEILARGEEERAHFDEMDRKAEQKGQRSVEELLRLGGVPEWLMTHAGEAQTHESALKDVEYGRGLREKKEGVTCPTLWPPLSIAELTSDGLGGGG